MSYRCDLSANEHMTILAALNERSERCEKYATDCESLAVEHRRFPTDDPELWRTRAADARSLYAKLCNGEPT